MHWIPPIWLLAQVSPDDVAREVARMQRNFEFLSYGFAAAWIVLAIYVLMMVGRERRLNREISSLKAMLEERESQKK
jgi:CcmD family protein